MASQESTLGANPAIARPNADGDAGPFQQRQLPGWYGTLAQVTNPAYAATTFFLGHTITAAQAVAAGTRPAGAAGYHITGLADVRNWPNLDIIDAADQVQRSAFPDAVADDIPLARQLVAKFDAGKGKSVASLPNAELTTATCGGTTTPQQMAQTVAIGKAVTPVEQYTITATFGEVGSWARYHTGLDFAAPIGTPVRAALSGTVTHAGFGGAAASWAGDYVTIKHADGTSTLYAHMSAIFVVSGQAVSTADRIGSIGVTGRSFGPHLHFEAYPKGVQPGAIYRATDPAKWLGQHDVVGRFSPGDR
ncbi:M23 family metallopeptidase [Microlunatus endophyticus]|uniref:M23 family metallopeptidase n=1 Tax=Microlunatus endophyticus TaxID=1716077 RepID=UPI00166E8DA3|nr:M23 family metallopeptidase [Microlunatus endophyticus]